MVQLPELFQLFSRLFAAGCPHNLHMCPCVHRVSDLNIDAVLVCNWSQPPTRDGAAGEPDPGLRQTITSISDLTDFQGKEGGAPLLIRLSHNDVRNEGYF